MKWNYKILSLIILTFFVISINSAAQDKEEPEYEMKQYFLVLLKKGENRAHDSLTVQKIQAGHMAHISKMAEDKKLDIAGPIGANEDLRGIFILNVETIEEAKELCESDPAVQSGRLTYEVYPWWGANNSCLR